MLVQDYFERSRRRNPSKAAITYQNHQLSYEELGLLSDKVCSILTHRRMGREPVGFWMRRSPEAVGAILGILKSGGCYVPLDPDAPVARIGTVVADCGMRAVVVDDVNLAKLPELLRLAPELKLIILSGEGAAPGDVESVRLSAPIEPGTAGTERVTDAELAYIFYTSGSTGKPKGVMISHLNVVNFVDWAVEFFGVTAEDNLSNPTPLFFDLSTFDLHVTFAAGATLHMIDEKQLLSPKAIVEWIDRTRLTIWFSVPSVLSYLLRFKAVQPGSFPHLRKILWCGEVFPTRDLIGWMETLPDKLYANLYGPTETTVASTCQVFDRPPADPARPISIGKPCDNTKVLIIGEQGRVCPPGEEGELCIGGNSVMKGYWRLKEKTREMLIQNPLHDNYPDLYYRTGDIAVQETDGTLNLRGRRDFQVKVRGYRIELGDIEAAVLSHPAIESACLAPYPAEEFGGTRLKLYFTTREAQLEPSTLRQFLGGLLPKYMVPERMERLDAMPRLPNGKVDRRACASRAF